MTIYIYITYNLYTYNSWICLRTSLKITHIPIQDHPYLVDFPFQKMSANHGLSNSRNFRGGFLSHGGSNKTKGYAHQWLWDDNWDFPRWLWRVSILRNYSSFWYSLDGIKGLQLRHGCFLTNAHTCARGSALPHFHGSWKFLYVSSRPYQFKTTVVILDLEKGVAHP